MSTFLPLISSEEEIEGLVLSLDTSDFCTRLANAHFMHVLSTQVLQEGTENQEENNKFLVTQLHQSLSGVSVSRTVGTIVMLNGVLCNNEEMVVRKIIILVFLLKVVKDQEGSQFLSATDIGPLQILLFYDVMTAMTSVPQQYSTTLKMIECLEPEKLINLLFLPHYEIAPSCSFQYNLVHQTLQRLFKVPALPWKEFSSHPLIISVYSHFVSLPNYSLISREMLVMEKNFQIREIFQNQIFDPAMSPGPFVVYHKLLTTVMMPKPLLQLLLNPIQPSKFSEQENRNSDESTLSPDPFVRQFFYSLLELKYLPRRKSSKFSSISCDLLSFCISLFGDISLVRDFSMSHVTFLP
eukprot:TRINITY_DN9797_c0_g1_i1.p1 TRINITY_DN9797_c0_g1~~TRINITY_DN9797_c0_g1_i1.p1  ORF type:complete len:353 (+),score=67.36 TRINITY_DN9797_c0_g1_i1:744-1802(+)